MLKFRVLYPTLIAGKIRKTGEILELSEQTDSNFLKRLISIKALEEILEVAKDEPKQPPKAKKQPSKNEPKE